MFRRTSRAQSSSSSSSSTSADLQEIAGNFDTFISILTTQLKNQDPTSASDTNQFTQELVEFAQVEQQLATNTKLDTLVSDVSANTSASLLNYVGKYVQSSKTSSDVVVQNGTAEFAYSLTDTAKSVAVTIKDSSGSTVATMSGPTSSGIHKVEWDGTEDKRIESLGWHLYAFRSRKRAPQVQLQLFPIHILLVRLRVCRLMVRAAFSILAPRRSVFRMLRTSIL